MRLASIHTYPVKGCHRLDHDRAVVQPWGLAGDRRWLVVEPDGRFVTQRVEPRLALIRPADDGGGLVLRTPGMPDLDVPAPDPEAGLTVRIWDDHLRAVPAGPDADDWLSAALDRKVRLVHLADPTQRVVDQRWAAPGDRVGFADAYPVLLTAQASLDALNDWLVEAGDEPVPMTRFRPNLVLGGAPAWIEDELLGRRVRLGSVTFRVVKPCDRCVVTTVDQETAERTHQPLRMLGQRRRHPLGLLFGTNLVPDADGPGWTGRLSVGDELQFSPKLASTRK